VSGDKDPQLAMLDDTIRCLKAYEAAGADALMAPGLTAAIGSGFSPNLFLTN
jgi:2-methylisocitrate lyase-like PEP mutase family enzyme